MLSVTLYETMLSGSSMIGEPIRKNTFEVLIEGLEGICPFAVSNISVPLTANIEAAEIYHFNMTWKIASKASYDDVTITVRQTLLPDAAQTLIDWKKKVYDDENEVMGYTTDYKRNGWLFQFDVKKIPIRIWKLVGVWPKSLGNLEHDYSAQGEPMEITVTLSVDKVIPEF